MSAAERMRRYRARRKQAGLRARMTWEPRVAAPVPYSDHRLLDARSLAMHCAVVRRLQREPALLDRARRTLERWLAGYPSAPPRALLEWRALIARSWSEVATAVTSGGENAARLRQSSPLATLLSAAERRRIYAAFRA
jgi:hypothetical protein